MFTEEKAHILGTRTTKNGHEVIKSSVEKIEDINNIDNLPFFIITNKETLRNKDIIKALQTQADKIDMCIYDEIHMSKNIQSQQGKGLLKVDCGCKIALSGTPILNNPLDTYMVMRWLGYETHSMTAYKQRYCEFGGYGGYEIVGYKNINELKERFSGVQLRRLKENCLNLPPKIYETEYLELSQKQKILYSEVYNDIAFNVDNKDLSQNPLVRTIRLRQVTANPAILSDKITDSVKYDRCIEMVEELSKEGRKCLIFSNWVDVINPLYVLLQKYNPALIIGGTKDIEKEKSKLNTDPTCSCCLGTIGAMGTSHTLTGADTVIFLDEPWNRGTKEQCEDRCFLKGTEILTPLGFKSIEDIKVGDMVYSGDGKIVKVKDAWATNYNGNIAKIKLWGSKKPIYCTEDHRFLVDGKWIEAKHLSKGSILSFIENNNKDYNDFIYPPNLCKCKRIFIGNKGQLITNGRLINAKPIKITDEFLYFCGYYLGDGFSRVSENGGSCIGVSGNTYSKMEALKLCNKWFKQVGLKTSYFKSKKDKGNEIRSYSREYALWFKYLFGDNTYEKHFPDFIYKLSNRQLEILLKGLKDSDGYVRKTHQFSYSTTSNKLCANVLWLLSVCGYKPSYSWSKSSKCFVLNCILNKDSSNYRIRSGKIRSIEFEHKKDVVYDIEVEGNHTFVVNNIVVHNCHRIGTKNTVNIITFICKNTIDERINQIVQEKGEWADCIVDGKVLRKSEEILKFLLS